MRALVQTVSRASVTVGDEVTGSITDGLLVLVGVTHDDTPATAETLARKVHELRILDDEASAADAGAPLLVVSQFTLYGDARKGRRPTWSRLAWTGRRCRRPWSPGSSRSARAPRCWPTCCVAPSGPASATR